MRLLELFSGTGSMGRAFRDLGWDVVSLDITPGRHTIRADILDWDYTVFPRRHFDAIHASPPCTQYSIARTCAKTPRNLEYADSLVQRALIALPGVENASSTRAEAASDAI
jgi:site-specific DNA-cytosine methylase